MGCTGWVGCESVPVHPEEARWYGLCRRAAGAAGRRVWGVCPSLMSSTVRRDPVDALRTGCKGAETWVQAAATGHPASPMTSAELRQRQPLGPREVTSDVARALQRPVRGDPARDELVERSLELGAHALVHHPPRDLRVGARLLRRVDVDAAQQRRLVGVEECVVERLVRLHLRRVAGQVGTVGLVRHVGGRPPPRLAVDAPEPLARAHDGDHVEVGVLGADRPQVVPERDLDPGRVAEVGG